MSALAGPGDLAGSLGEMAAERRHLLRVWAAGMLAEVSFGLETQATAQAEPLAGTCHLLPGSWTAQPGSTLFFLPPNQQSMGKWVPTRGPLASLGSVLSPGLTMGRKLQDLL